MESHRFSSPTAASVSSPTSDEALLNRIVATARERFMASGFSRVTMGELAKELGISTKTMYKHFRSKNSLLDTVVEWQMMSARTEILQIVHSPAGYLDKLQLLFSTVARILSLLSKQIQADLQRFRPDLWARIAEFRQKAVLATFSELLDEGLRLGVIRRDCNKDIIILLYICAIDGIVTPQVLSQHPFSAEDAFHAIARVVFDGILTDEARPLYRGRLLPEKPKEKEQ